MNRIISKIFLLPAILLGTIFVTQTVQAQCFRNGLGDQMVQNASSTSGNYRLDQFVNIEKAKLESLLGVRVKFLFANTTIVNAFAYNIPDGYNDGIVLFTTGILDDLEYDKGRIKAVMAHEFGHIAQYKYGGFEGLPTIKAELFADYVAGIYIGLGINDGSISLENFWSSLMTESDYGDYSFGSPDHHGTPQQRANAAAIGGTVNGAWFHGKYNIPAFRSFHELYQIGLELLKKNYLEATNVISDVSVFKNMLHVALSHTHSALVNKAWLEFNAFQNGENGIIVHIDCNIFNMNVSMGNAVAWFYFENGTPLKDYNGQYVSTDGTVSASSQAYKITYNNSWFKDITIFIPYRELHMPIGSYDLKCTAGLFVGNDRIGELTEPMHFNFRQ